MLEIAVRTLHLVPDRFWQPDPLLGARLVPGKRGWWTQEEREFVVPVQINSRGWRDVERDWEKPPGVQRVLVIGDSFVEAMHVPLEQTFCRRLEALLNGQGGADRDGAARFEVVCAGVSGWGTASEYLWFREEGFRYAPDWVLLSFYPGNDIKNNSPLLEDTLRPEYDERGDLRRVVSAKPPRVGTSWSDRFRLLAYLRQRLVQAHPNGNEWLARLGIVPRNGHQAKMERQPYPADYDVYASPWSEPWSDAWARTERLLNAFHRESVARGSRFAVVVIPGREQTDPTSWMRILETYPSMKGRPWALEAPQQAVLKWCGRAAVPCLELLSSFREAHARSGDPLHFPYDGHFTAAGHAVAAEAISRFVLANSASM